MGMHGSATCTMAFEGANGWLAGHANDGIRNMFVMMNLERIGVGVQGLGLCELATQAAIGYARARRQGKAFNGRNEIIEHPDVRRMLLQMKAMTEGARVMAYERSEEHTSELQSLMRISYAVFCLKKTNTNETLQKNHTRRNTKQNSENKITQNASTNYH